MCPEREVYIQHNDGYTCIDYLVTKHNIYRGDALHLYDGASYVVSFSELLVAEWCADDDKISQLKELTDER